MKNLSKIIFVSTALLILNGCGPSNSPIHNIKDVDSDIIPNNDEFYLIYRDFKDALFEKDWIKLYKLLPVKETKIFPNPNDFEEYLDKNAKKWKLNSLKELTSRVDIFDVSDEKKVSIEVYFYAEVMPGRIKYYGSLVFTKYASGKWDLKNWELLGLPTIQFYK